MRTSSRVSRAVALLWVLLSASIPAGQQLPPRDRVSTAAASAVIRGSVTASDTGRPVRRARVTVTAPELSGPPRIAGTDSNGRYEVRDLPPGRYRVSVARSGYLPLQYGQRRPLELGTPLDVSSGQTVAGVDFVMPRAGVIAGRVLDELGDPIEGVMVVAMRSRYCDGQRRLVTTGR